MIKVPMKDAKVKVRSIFHMEGSALKGTLKGSCKGFQIDLHVESDAPRKKLDKLIKIAHNSCFLEDALSKAINIEYQNYINGEKVEAED
jgi:organic hydroperoxide reductase OsmC/OhrA